MVNYLVFLETKHQNITPKIFEVGTNYIQFDDQRQPNKQVMTGLQLSDSSHVIVKYNNFF